MLLGWVAQALVPVRQHANNLVGCVLSACVFAVFVQVSIKIWTVFYNKILCHRLHIMA